MAIKRKDLERYLLGCRFTMKKTAELLGVSVQEVRNSKKIFAIDGRNWWKYQGIFCPECGIEIDPERRLDENARKKLLKETHVYCEECKLAIKRKKDRDQKRQKREADRETYNEYQRNLRKKGSAHNE